MGAPAQLLQVLIPDTQDNSLSFSVLNYLKRLKNQAKVEFEKLCADVINKSSSNNTQKVRYTRNLGDFSFYKMCRKKSLPNSMSQIVERV